MNREFLKQHNIDSILILSILLKNYTNRGEIVFSINYLLDELRIKRTNTNRINKVKQILNSLVKDNVLNTNIDFMSIKNNDIVRVDYELVKDNFTIVYDFEVEEILNADTTIDKYAMFYLFVFIKYRLNTNTQVMYWSIKDMAKEMNTKSNKTVLGYIDMLEEIGLLKIGKVGMRVFADNTIKQANNIYTLGYLEDTDKILQEQLSRYKAELNEHSIKIEQGKKSSEQTSIKLKLNNLWKKYDDEDITDDEIGELKKLQKKYYEFIKLDDEKVKNTPFILFDENKVIDTSSGTEQENENWDEEEVSINDMINDLFGIEDVEESMKITENYVDEKEEDSICDDVVVVEDNESDEEIIKQEIANFRSMYSYINIETCEKLFATDEEIQYILSSSEFLDATIESKHNQCQNMLNNSLEKLHQMQNQADMQEEANKYNDIDFDVVIEEDMNEVDSREKQYQNMMFSHIELDNIDELFA